MEPQVLVANLVRNLPTGGKDLRVVVYPEWLAFLRTGRYHLRAVVTHQGNSTSEGHYVSTVRCSDGCFRVFNDSSVSQPRSFEDFGRQEAYILIYEREDDGSARRLGHETTPWVRFGIEGGSVSSGGSSRGVGSSGSASSGQGGADAAMDRAAATEGKEIASEGRAKRGRAQEAEAGDGQWAQERGQRAHAAEGRAVAEEQRGIGDVGRARQMAARAKARTDLDEKEKRGRGRH